MKFIIDDEAVNEHKQYKVIMDTIANPEIDVSADTRFRSAYSGYYFPAQVSKEFKDLYFGYMEKCRENLPEFTEALQYFYDNSGAVHYSFTSKLMHTLNPNYPVLDKHVLRLLGFQLMDARQIDKDDPDYQSKKDADAEQRIKYYSEVFDQVAAEYKKYENEPFMLDAIRQFDEQLDEKFPDFSDLTYTKKVDMLLFRLRKERAVSILDYLYETQL